MTRRLFLLILTIAVVAGFFIFIYDDLRQGIPTSGEIADSAAGTTPTEFTGSKATVTGESSQNNHNTLTPTSAESQSVPVPAESPYAESETPPSTATPSPVTSSASEDKQLPHIAISPLEVFPGGYLKISVSGVILTEITVECETGLTDAEIHTYIIDGSRTALVPVDYRTQPGEYEFGVKVYDYDGAFMIDASEIITVMQKDFPEQYLTVTEEQKSTRSDENWAKDGEHTSRARSTTLPEPVWEGKFLMPVEGPITSEFGLIRYINNEESGRHSGLDISAVAGTPVRASNSGRVNLSMELVITGNTIILDHGSNVFSAYCHLDKLLVDEGNWVEKGDIIGEVGSTGFSTGPHLHWTISIGNTFVSPWLFMEKDPLK